MRLEWVTAIGLLETIRHMGGLVELYERSEKPFLLSAAAY